MKLFINGFPKCGNHALQKACELLGQPTEVNHRPFSEGLPEGTTHSIFIKRDPRNIVVSAIRHYGKQVTPGTFLTCFRRFELAGKVSLIEEMTKFEGWLSHPSTLVVRYEDLIATDATMRGIAVHLGVPYLEGAFDELPGLTQTWNEQHSDYTSVWIPEVTVAWKAEGGKDLLTRWGY